MNNIKFINELLINQDYLENKDEILEFIKDNELRDYFVNKLKGNVKKLQDIEFILDRLIKKSPQMSLNVIESNISQNNVNFTIDFLQKNYKNLENEKWGNNYQEFALGIIQKILDNDELEKDYKQILGFIESIFELRNGQYKDTETKRDFEREKILISETLPDIFNIAEDKEIKDQIYKLIIENFNLVADDGEYNFYTPREIFNILKEYINSYQGDEFEDKFLEFKQVLIKQFDEFYKNVFKQEFKGFELMGGMGSGFGGNLVVLDRHFVRLVLKPCLEEHYKENNEKAWQFIKDKIIETDDDQISKEKTDFLNRAALYIVLDRYFQLEKIIDEFDILKSFILSKKGIPHKSALIYQAIKNNNENQSDDKRWQLVEVAIDNYKDPLKDDFVRNLVIEFAQKGNEDAGKLLSEFDDYDRYSIKDVEKLIFSEKDVDYEMAIKIFMNFIKTDDFINNHDRFDTFDLAKTLNHILRNEFEKESDKGKEIIESIFKNKSLTENQQILVFRSLFSHDDNLNNAKFLNKVHDEILNPFLEKYDKDITKISKVVSDANSRQAMVEFVEKLIKSTKNEEKDNNEVINKETSIAIKKALDIISIFINDEEIDEDLQEQDKRIRQGEHVPVITTVKGYCAWTLTSCATLDGRKYIENVIELTEQLVKDENLYIKQMACFPLSQLAANRLTVLPIKNFDGKIINSEVLFLDPSDKTEGKTQGDDLKNALEKAKKIEEIAFNLLENIANNYDDKVEKVLLSYILKIFNHIRALNQTDAEKLINNIEKFPLEAIADSATPLYIYYAEFRKDSYKDWQWQADGLYDDLDDFDSKPFEEKIINYLKGDNVEINEKFSWQFYSLAESAKPDEYDNIFDISIKYLKVLAENIDPESSKNIFMFIKNNIDKKNDECFELYKHTFLNLSHYINLHPPTKGSMFMWYPEDILLKIKELGRGQEFLELFSQLLDLPKELYLGDLVKLVKILKEDYPKEGVSDVKVRKIFDKLIKRDPKYYDDMEEWEEK